MKVYGTTEGLLAQREGELRRLAGDVTWDRVLRHDDPISWLKQEQDVF